MYAKVLYYNQVDFDFIAFDIIPFAEFPNSSCIFEDREKRLTVYNLHGRPHGKPYGSTYVTHAQHQ